MTEALPGTHLARLDCTDCGDYVLAIPEHPDPRCARCGRDHHAALTLQVDPSASWSGLSDSTPAVPLVPAPEVKPDLPWTAICPRCRRRFRVRTADEVSLVLGVHHRAVHDPKGWASGVTGGLRR